MIRARRTSIARPRGMTLIELMVAVAIVAIIASLAVPSYSAYVTRSKRAVAKSALSLVADQQEQFFLDNKRYADDLTEIGYDSEKIGVDESGQAVAADADGRVYVISLDDTSATTYTIEATPQLAQADQDTACGTLSLTQAGQKLQSGDGTDCW
jgi:type IV pilus assembly protein PilE